MLVMKFGGTSVKDASAMESVINIVTSHASSETGTVVVLSATAGTTSQLLEMGLAASRGQEVEDLIREISHRHSAMLLSLAPDADIQVIASLCDQLRDYLHALSVLGECSDESLDTVASYGERLSTSILHESLQARGHGSTLIPATSLIATNSSFQQASVNRDTTTQQCRTELGLLLNSRSIIITQGFLGSTEDGRITTLGRGGSDYSAALIGRALSAREIQIWTDVSGVYSADPRIIQDAAPLETVSFDEMRTLALYGAKVLHPDTIVPAIEAAIPVRVLNTFAPSDIGTVITNESSTDADIHAITLVRPCLRVCCSGDAQFLLHLQSVLAQHILSYHATRSGVSLVVHVPTADARLAMEVALVGSQYSIEDVGLFVVTGPSAHRPHIVELISDKLSTYGDVIVTASLQPHCTMASVPLAACIDACNSVHGLIHPRHR